jgi:hypothetical protein
VRQVPPEIAADLASAATAEREARAAVRAAVRRQVALLRRLRDDGVPFTATTLARVLGEEPSPEVRRRLSARLQQRVHRTAPAVTERHAEQRPAPPQASSARLPSNVASNKEDAMPKEKLIKRVTTVETYEAADVDPEIDADEDEEVEDEESDDEDATSRKKHRR